MAVKTQAQLLAQVASLLADNTTGDISALDVRTCLNDIIDSASYGGKKVYKALLTQTGTSAPVSTVLVNTLSGTPVWSRVSIGYYKLTLSSEFTNNKTYYPPFGEMGNILSDGSSGITLYDDTGGILGFYHFYKLSSSEFVLKSYDGSFNAVDISSIIGTGYICLPPIEVYP